MHAVPGGVVTPDELREAATAALASVADQLDEGGDRLDVRGSQHVAACPAAVALDGESAFEPSAGVVAWELASEAGDRIIHGPLDPRSGRAAATPVDALAMAVDEVEGNWAFDWWAKEGEPARSVAQAAVVRRLAGIARLAKAWPPEPPVTYGHRPSWPFPGRPLRLVGRADLVLGRRGHGHRLVVALAGDHGPLTRSRLAFETVVDALALRRPAAAVVGLLPDAGRRWSIAVDDGFLAEGVQAAAGAAGVALGARRGDAAGLPRTPSPRCRWCDHRVGCDDGETWLAGPGRLRSGFLPLG